MQRSNIFGVVLILVAMFALLFEPAVSLHAFGVIWVLVGAIGCGLVAYGQSTLFATVALAIHSLREGERDANQTLRTMLTLSDLSRRSGLTGMADVNTNWGPLRKACLLMAGASDDHTIREELRVEKAVINYRYDGLLVRLRWLSLFLWVFTCLAVLCYQIHHVEVTTTLTYIGVPGVLISGLLMALVISRLTAVLSSEINSLEIVFEGSIRILKNNSKEIVFTELSKFVPSEKRKSIDELGLSE